MSVVVISQEAQALARRIGASTPAQLIDVECGLHSGFPPCCVAFFVGVWWPALVLDGANVMSDTYHDMRVALGLDDVGYVACPACLLVGNVVTVRKCRCHAPLDHQARKGAAEGHGLAGTGPET